MRAARRKTTKQNHKVEHVVPKVEENKTEPVVESAPLSKPIEEVQNVPQAEQVNQANFTAPTAAPIQSQPLAATMPMQAQDPNAEPPLSSDPLAEFKGRLQNDSFSVPPQKKNFMWPILFVFIIALLALGGAYYYKQGGSKAEEAANIVPISQSPTEIPTPTVEEVDLSEYEIEILNGSGVEGEAGRQQTNLEDEGFTVSSIGNAEESDYTKTLIQAKEEVDKEFLDKLKEVLEKSFVVDETEILEEEAESDVIVIIGSETSE